MRVKPLLLVDIDGVLSLFGFPSSDRPAGSWISVDGILHLISATASEHLHRLAQRFELVWCSGWEEKANEFLLAPLSLPSPPVPHVLRRGHRRPLEACGDRRLRRNAAAGVDRRRP